MTLFKHYSLKYSFLIVASIQFLLAIFKLLSVPSILYDEPLYSYTALFFSENGHFQHNFHQFSGKEFCFYPFLLGCVFFIFGPSLLVGRLFSVLLGIISLYFFMKLIKQLSLKPSLFYLLSLSFVFLNTNFVAFRIIRPESLLLCFTCMLLWYLYKYLHLNLATVKDKLTLGLCLSAIISTHMIGALFGLIICFGVLTYIIKYKSFNDLIWIFIGSLLPIFIIVANTIHIFSYSNLGNQITKVSPSLNVLKKNISVFFLDNYVMGFKRAYIVLFETIILLFAIFNKRFFTKLISFACFFVVFYGFFAIADFIRPYYILFPTIALIIVGLLSHQSSTKLSHLLTGLLCIYFLNNIAGDIFIFYKNKLTTPFSFIQTSFQPYIVKETSLVGGSKKLWFIKPHLQWLSLDAAKKTETSFYYFYSSKAGSGISSLSQQTDVYHQSTQQQSFPLQEKFKNKTIELIAEDEFPGYDLIQLYKIN